MGGSGGKKSDKPSVEYAAPIDYAALMASASAAASGAFRDQIAAQIEAYPKMERQQLGTINKIANRLGQSRFTKDARSQVRGAEVDAQRAGAYGRQIGDIGQQLRREAGPTEIELELRSQAQDELALGRGLSPEQIRDSQQAARFAFAARGLGTSLGSSTAEILNRDAMASAREAERRNFAAATNQLFTQNVAGRRTNAAGVLGNAVGAMGQAAGIRQANAGILQNLDPYQRALGAMGIGSTIGTNLSNQTGQTWSGAQQMAGNVASFNASMIDSRANTAMNNWAAMNAARMQSSALGQQGMMGMIGGIGGGALAGGGAILAATSF